MDAPKSYISLMEKGSQIKSSDIKSGTNNSGTGSDNEAKDKEDDEYSYRDKPLRDSITISHLES